MVTPLISPNYMRDLARARANYAAWLGYSGQTCTIRRPDKDSQGLSTGEMAAIVATGVPCKLTYAPIGSMSEPMLNTTQRRRDAMIPGGVSRMSFAHGTDVRLGDTLVMETAFDPHGKPVVYNVGVPHYEDPDSLDTEVEVEVRRTGA